jgi:integrase
MIPRNVAEAPKAPRPAPEEIRPLSREQTKTLLEVAKKGEERFETLYVLAVTAGLRQGELLGLKWEDIDLNAGTLRVRRTLSTAIGGGFGFSPPKTAKGRRSIKLPESALSSLKNHRKAQLEMRDRITGLWEDHGLVFTTHVGTPISRQDLITRSFKPLLQRAELPNIRFHDLRHTCATLLLCRGVHAKLVQELLGHATISVTLDTYSHVLPSMTDQTATAMEDVLS